MTYVPPEDVALVRGSHDSPEAGRCLMEHVSVLAGARFTPLPPCTHPVLAALVMQVNDRVSDATRVRLVRHADALVGAGRPDPALTWRLVEHAARSVLDRRPDDRRAARRWLRARRARRRWDRLLPPSRHGRLPRWATGAVALSTLAELLAAVRALCAVAGPPGSPERDRALTTLLDTAIVTTVAARRPSTGEVYA